MSRTLLGKTQPQPFITISTSGESTVVSKAHDQVSRFYDPLHPLLLCSSQQGPVWAHWQPPVPCRWAPQQPLFIFAGARREQQVTFLQARVLRWDFCGLLEPGKLLVPSMEIWAVARCLYDFGRCIPTRCLRESHVPPHLTDKSCPRESMPPLGLHQKIQSRVANGQWSLAETRGNTWALTGAAWITAGL